MFAYSFVKWALVLIAPLVRETNANYSFQIGGGAIAVTGYFAASGVYEAQAIKQACYGNWRHANVNGLECSFAVAQTMAWHTFVISLGVGGGTYAKYAMKTQGEGASQQASRSEQTELRNRDYNLTDTVIHNLEVLNTTFSSDEQYADLVHVLNSLDSDLRADNVTIRGTGSPFEKRQGWCQQTGYTLREGWFSFRDNRGLKYTCEPGCETRHFDTGSFSNLMDTFARTASRNEYLVSQFTVWSPVSRRVIGRCGMVWELYGASVCPEKPEGDSCTVPSGWR